MIREGKLNWLVHDLTHRGITAWILTAVLTGFYLLLYFSSSLDAVARSFGLGSKWTLYGVLYSIAIIAGGIYVIRKYRHNNYQIVRTCVVMLVQVVFAFSIPQLLKFFHQPEYYMSYFWPLKFDYMNPRVIFNMPAWIILYSFIGSLIFVPLMGVFFGKRWYCSWVCGCGGLANTAGDPFRHLSSKSGASWKFEKVAVHSVLGICIVLTALLFVTWGVGNRYPTLGYYTYKFQAFYGLIVVTMMSGIVGVAAYPLGGTRLWCRHFCPMAAMLGLIQKFGRFRITVKKDMCISCGLCSRNCEMGIDVRSYAQANESFTRASCVGCGLCAEVCPRGILKLENITRRDPQERHLILTS